MPDHLADTQDLSDDAALDEATRPSAGGRILRLGARLGFAGLLVAAMAGGISFLHLRAELRGAPDAVPPLAVAVTQVVLQGDYPLHERFAGRLEARRSTDLGFERGGLLTEVLVEEGDAIESGQVIARLDTAPLQARRAELEAEREALLARLELARITTERQKQLSRQGNSSKQRYDEARLEAQALNAQVLSVEAALSQLDITIAKSTLFAPYAGRIAARASDEGSILAAGAAVVTLLESQVLEARIGLSAPAAAGLEIGRSYPLEIAGRRQSGRLTALRPDMAGGTRTVAALFRLQEPAAAFLGELAVLALEKRVEQEGFWVPVTALVSAPKGLWTLYTAVPEGDGGHRVGLEAVVVHHLDDERAYVSGSLLPGSLAILAGPHRVAPGQRVTPHRHEEPNPDGEEVADEPAAQVVFKAPGFGLPADSGRR